jgi:hypothetical protein
MDFILIEFKYHQNKRNKRNKSLKYQPKESSMSSCPLVRRGGQADHNFFAALRPARRGGSLRE